MKNIYVGNLSYQTTEEELRKIFAPYGSVERVSIPLDSVTGKSRGFAFVEMQDEAATQRRLGRMLEAMLSLVIPRMSLRGVGSSS